MHATRSLHRGLLILLLAGAPLGASERVAFLGPTEGDIVVGPTRFSFSVPEREPPIERIDVYVAGRQIDSALPGAWSFEWDVPRELIGAEYQAVVYADGRVVDKLRLTTSEIDLSEEIDVVEVQLFPVVVDRKGRYVGGLAREDFAVFDRGKQVTIKAFSQQASSLNLAMVLDISASMLPDLTLMKEASCRFIDSLAEGDRVTLYAFNHALLPEVPLTDELEQPKNAIRGLSASGSTALYDAVLRVLADLREVRGRKAVLLFSDGLDKRSVSSLDRTIEMARRSEVIIYAVAAERDAEAAERHDLRMLAEETGGELYIIDKFKQLPAAFSSILDDLRAQYRLAYDPPAGPSGERALRVELPAHRKYRVRCRKSYYFEAK